MSKYNSNNSAPSDIGSLGVLQIIFIVLKLTGHISWSWAAVLIPTWISLGIFFVDLSIAAICGMLHVRKHKR